MDTVDELLRGLGTAWDAGDADAVAAHFTVDADFVDVLGRLQQGRATIAREHRSLFESIYSGSTCVFREIGRRELGSATVVHSASLLHAPHGPRRGDTHATQTLLVEDGAISVFHNTVQDAMERFAGADPEAGRPERADPGGVAAPRDPRLR